MVTLREKDQGCLGSGDNFYLGKPDMPAFKALESWPLQPHPRPPCAPHFQPLPSAPGSSSPPCFCTPAAFPSNPFTHTTTSPICPLPGKPCPAQPQRYLVKWKEHNLGVRDTALETALLWMEVTWAPGPLFRVILPQQKSVLAVCSQ